MGHNYDMSVYVRVLLEYGHLTHVSLLRMHHLIEDTLKTLWRKTLDTFEDYIGDIVDSLMIERE